MIQRLKSLFLCLCLISCSSGNNNDQVKALRQWMEPNGKTKVLCTTGMIEDIVSRIGGDHVDTLTLILGELDPHSYQLVKGDDEKLLFADIVFSNGLDLEHGPSLKKYLSEKKTTVSLGDVIRRNDSSKIIEVEGQIDPHIWMDMALWSEIVDPIIEALSKYDPSHADDYQENGRSVRAALLGGHEMIKATLSIIPLERRYLVTSHDAFHYFSRAYLATEDERVSGAWRNRCAAPEGLAPDSMLSSADIQEIIDHLQEYQVEVLFSESNVNRDSIEKIVSAGREKGLNIRIADCFLYGDAMGNPGSDGDTYIKMIAHNARVISEQLK